MGRQETTTGKLERGGRRATGSGPGARSETEREGAVRNEGEGRLPDEAGPGVWVTLLRVAWLAIALGLAMQALRLLLAAGFGAFPGLGPAVADLVGQVSWSVVVCAGLALGTAASTARAPVMGLMGLLSAPLALNVSRSLHQGTVAALDIAGTAAGGPSPLLLALIKGVEYACLGVAVGWIGRRPWGGALAHAAVGLVVGVIFGGAILALTYATAPAPLPAVALISRGANEIFFPVGCSLVLFAAQALAKKEG